MTIIKSTLLLRQKKKALKSLKHITEFQKGSLTYFCHKKANQISMQRNNPIDIAGVAIVTQEFRSK